MLSLPWNSSPEALSLVDALARKPINPIVKRAMLQTLFTQKHTWEQLPPGLSISLPARAKRAPSLPGQPFSCYGRGHGDEHLMCLASLQVQTW